MVYLSAYDWQPQENRRSAVSLLVQEVYYGRRQIIFACLCTDSECEEKKGEFSGYLTGRLQEWFCRQGLAICKRGRIKDLERFEREFTQTVERAEDEFAGWRERKRCKECKEQTSDISCFVPCLTGILCVGDRFLFFSKGKQHILMLNTRYGRSALKSLTGQSNNSGEKGQLKFCIGEIQIGIGLLLASESFYNNVTEAQIMETLKVTELTSQIQLVKHLRELGNKARTNAKEKADDISAIALITKTGNSKNKGYKIYGD